MRQNWPTSVFLLLSANFIPLLGVIFWGWNIVDLLFLYWSESAVIGFYSLLKIALIRDEAKGLVEKVMYIISKVFALVGFFLSHGYSFVTNFLIKGEKDRGKGADPILSLIKG